MKTIEHMLANRPRGTGRFKLTNLPLYATIRALEPQVRSTPHSTWVGGRRDPVAPPASTSPSTNLYTGGAIVPPKHRS